MKIPSVRVSAIPAFEDNYIWLLRGPGRDCAVVDPGDAGPVLQVLREKGLDLRHILLTHHHRDHAGGVPELLEHSDALVHGPVDPRLGDWCRPCREGGFVEIPELDLRLGVLEIPAHTRSHIAFHGAGMLFCGDTLFSVGCGRLFEGSPGDLQAALDKLAALPPDTLVYCGHEYTVSNCRFALQVEPDNPVLQARAAQAEAQRAAGDITLPSRLGEELQCNPFMRSRQPAVVAAARSRDPAAQPGTSTLGVIRAWKDAG